MNFLFDYVLLPWVCHFVPYWLTAFFCTMNSVTVPDTITLLTNLMHTTINFWLFSTGWFYLFPLPITGPVSVDIFCFAISLILYDIIFYHLHRLFHHKFFYRFHAKHHEWRFPIPVSALDCSVIEYWVLNLLPAFASLYIAGVSYYSSLLASIFFVSNAVLAHTDWHSPSSHSFHHLYRNVNYGTLGLMDKIYGTYFKLF
jgi:hypothetical protein